VQIWEHDGEESEVCVVGREPRREGDKSYMLVVDMQWGIRRARKVEGGW
jgi:hypothetical protein